MPECEQRQLKAFASKKAFRAIGYRLITRIQNFDGGEFDECEVVGAVLFKAGCDGSEVFEFAKEAFDEVAVSIEEGAERWASLAGRHWLDVRPRTACRHF